MFSKILMKILILQVSCIDVLCGLSVLVVVGVLCCSSHDFVYTLIWVVDLRLSYIIVYPFNDFDDSRIVII